MAAVMQQLQREIGCGTQAEAKQQCKKPRG
jgi:hypothetical protein